MKCDWEEYGLPTNDEGWRTVRCKRCGFITAPTPHSFDRIDKECVYLGVGDYVAHGLAAFGITKERVAWVREKFGGSGCGGCPERQEELNELGKKLGL